MQLEVLANRPEVSALSQSNLAVTHLGVKPFNCCEAVNFPRACGEGWVGRGDTAWMHTTLCA